MVEAEILKDDKGCLCMTNKEKKILIELICNEQTHMIMKHPESYESAKYKKLEQLKIKIKDLEE